MTLEDAYAQCERQAAAHYENFPVASWLLPPAMRPQIAAIYAFARTADDLADEGDATPAERLEHLDAWRSRLHEAVAMGDAVSAGRATVADETSATFVALADTVRRCGLPLSLFDDLISAFAQDVVCTRYPDWEALLDYSRRSANPVGRLVLRVAGVVDDRLDQASDAVCSALQFANFWQDIERDWAKGRVYVPEDVRHAAGADEADLAARRWTPEWEAALRECCRRTRALFDAGRPVCDGVSGRLRWELRATWLGGSMVLDKLEAQGFNVFAGRPTVGAADVPRLVWGALTW